MSASAGGTHLTNAVTEIVVGEGATVEHCKFQNESPAAYHMATFHAELARECQLRGPFVCVGRAAVAQQYSDGRWPEKEWSAF